MSPSDIPHPKTTAPLASDAEMASETAMVYVTFPDEGEALRLARDCVERKLAASANLFPAVRSIYRWKGVIEEARECILILKTHPDRVADLRSFIAARHSYEIPCILDWRVDGVHLPYAKWLRTETRSEGQT